MADITIDRKELKRPDAFVSRASIIFHWIHENFRVLVGMIVIIAIIVAGYLLYSKQQTTKAEKASSALYLAQKNVLSAQEKLSQSETEKMQKVLDEYSGSHAAYEAAMWLGDFYFDRGNSKVALDYYQKALKSAKARALKAGVFQSEAYAYENLKQYDKALEALQQVLLLDIKPLKADILLSMARVYELKTDKVKALEKYNQVLVEFPNTSAAKSAEIHKVRLEGKI